MPAHPGASSPELSERMSTFPRRDTAPELELRRELWRRGLRYRVDRPLDGKRRRRADLTFVGPKVVVFVDGCFWHGCPEHGTSPKANAEWWAEKLARNVARDADTDEYLTSQGWTVLRFWEHEDVLAAADQVERVVRARR
jgi:DNA mismatch endonuclease (patch repair protein)